MPLLHSKWSFPVFIHLVVFTDLSHSFGPQNVSGSEGYPRTKFLISSSNNGPEIELDLDSENQISDYSYSNESLLTNDSISTELWLDLRGTTIPPQEALLHITNDLCDELSPIRNKSFIVDKVLINTSDIKDIKKIAINMWEEFENQISLVIIEDGDADTFFEDNQCHDELFEIDERKGMIPIGRVVPIQKNDDGLVNINVDPMPVLDTVKGGKWAVLDTNNGVGSKPICSLVEFVSNGINSITFIDSLSNQKLDAGSRSSSVGGIGVRCQTHGNIVEMGSLFKTSMDSKHYKVTDSGILVQMNENGDPYTDKGQMLRKEVSGHNKSEMNYAIILPFDTTLWKTASLVFK